METGLTGLNEVEIPGALGADGKVDRDAVRTALAAPRPDRLLTIAQAFRHGLTLVEVLETTRFDPWFLRQVEDLVAVDEDVRTAALPQDADGWLRLKIKGFPAARLGARPGAPAEALRTAPNAAAATAPHTTTAPTPPQPP